MQHNYPSSIHAHYHGSVQFMKMGFRWYGDGNDTVTLDDIRQIPGVETVVWSLHHKQAGEAWGEAEIAAEMGKIAAISDEAAARGVTKRLDADVVESVNEILFQTDAERNLFAAYEKAAAAVGSDIASESYAEAITALAALAAPIDTFFDDVMVMDKDEKIKNNRLGLLKSIDQLVSRIADFTKIVLA